MFPSKIFMIYWRFHENYFFDQNLIKKKFCEKNFFSEKNVFLYENFFGQKSIFFDRKFEIRTQRQPLSSKMLFLSDFIVRIKSSQFPHVREIDPPNRSVSLMYYEDARSASLACNFIFHNLLRL